MRSTAAGDGPAQAALLCALLATLLVTGPLLLGAGVDMPVDALYFHLSSWEWLHYAWNHDQNPWWVPGTLGGVSLYANVVPMGPFYPAAWSLKFLGATSALPLVALLHGFAIVLAIRWMCRCFGVGRLAATLAGVGLMLGTVGGGTWIELRADTMATLLWFPVLLGAQERLSHCPSRRGRSFWAALAGGALALLLLGSHPRWSAAACGAFALWSLLRGLDLRWSLLIGILGLSGGMPGYLPSLEQLAQITDFGERLALLSSPAQQGIGLWNVPGFLAPAASVTAGDLSIGAILGLSALLGFTDLRGPLRRLGYLALLLVLASLSPELPGLRYLFAPLLLVTQPDNLALGALAMIPTVVIAAAGLEALAQMDPAAWRARLRSPAAVVPLVLVIAVASRLLPQSEAFAVDDSVGRYLHSIVQFLVVTVAAAWLVTRQSIGLQRRLLLLFALALLDLSVLAVRMHHDVPSEPLNLVARTHVGQLEQLRDGYLDTTDLQGLDSPRYGALNLSELQLHSDRQQRIRTATELARRLWPVHLGNSYGITGLAGRARLAPPRATALLEPLADVLSSGTSTGKYSQNPHPNTLQQIFSREHGAAPRIMALYGIPVAVGRRGLIGRFEPVAPLCYSPQSVTVIEDRNELADRLLVRTFRTRGPALLEASLEVDSIGAASSLGCVTPGSVAVETEGDSLVVLRIRHHPGWQVRDQHGVSLPTLPVNLVHTGVLVPAGSHELQYRFTPPGLQFSMAAGAAALLTIFALFALGVRQRQTDAADSPRLAASIPFSSPTVLTRRIAGYGTLLLVGVLASGLPTIRHVAQESVDEMIHFDSFLDIEAKLRCLAPYNIASRQMRRELQEQILSDTNSTLQMLTTARKGILGDPEKQRRLEGLLSQRLSEICPEGRPEPALRALLDSQREAQGQRQRAMPGTSKP